MASELDAQLAHLPLDEQWRIIRAELVRRAEQRETSSAASPLTRYLESFAALCAVLVITTKDAMRGIVSFAQSNWNAEQLRLDADRTGRDIVLKSRSIGISTYECARDVHFALKHSGVNVLLVGHDSDLVEQLFATVSRMVDALVALQLIPAPESESRREIVFAHNGSAIRIVEAGATERVAEKRGRSVVVHRLHATELAFWGAAATTMSAVRAACSPAAEIVIESTANGTAGTGELFHALCVQALAGAGEFRLHFFAWFEHDEYRLEPGPGFDPAPRDQHETRLRALGCTDPQIAWWRSKVDDPSTGGIDRVLQEYPYDPTLAFRAPGGRWLAPELTEWLVEVAMRPVRTERILVSLTRQGRPIGQRDFGELLVFGELAHDDEAVIGADSAHGGGGNSDACAARVRSRRTGALLGSFVSNTIGPGDFGIACAWIARHFRNALIGFERNDPGPAAIMACTTVETSATPYHRLFDAPDGKPGWRTTPQTRPVMWDEWHARLRAAHLEHSGHGLIDELGAREVRTLVLKNDRPEAQGGAHDDVFTADAIAWQMRSRASGSGGGARRERTRSDAERAGDLI